jgi:hypothetical protein
MAVEDNAGAGSKSCLGEDFSYKCHLNLRLFHSHWFWPRSGREEHENIMSRRRLVLHLTLPYVRAFSLSRMLSATGTACFTSGSLHGTSEPLSREGWLHFTSVIWLFQGQ